MKEDILRCGKGPMAVEVDIMEPYDPANHIGLWIDDLPACVKYLQEKGVRFTPGGIRKGAAGYDVTFIHPKGKDPNPLSGEGVLIELVQAPQNVIEYYEKLQ